MTGNHLPSEAILLPVRAVPGSRLLRVALARETIKPSHHHYYVMINLKDSNTRFFLVPGICYLTELVVWFSFPQSHLLNGVLGGLWTLGQVGILIILLNLYTWRIAGGSSWKVIGMVIAAAGAVSYLINYLFGYWLGMNTRVFLPMGALLSGVGMVVTGIQVLVGKRWPGIKGTLPLLVGLYPFLVMFPLLVITGHPDLRAIMGWGVPWLLLGIGMANERTALRTKTSHTTSPRGV